MIIKMSVENICRPIHLFNNFLPASDKDNKWEYCAFGTFDGISIEKPIYEMHQQGKDFKALLNKIWEHKKEFVKKLKGDFAVQTIYAVCSANRDEEEKFWEKKENDVFPFCFICRMQYRGNLQKLRERKNILKDSLEKIFGIMLWIYVTYDNSDLIVVIKAPTYESGAGAINSMHKNINFAFDNNTQCILKNSFTIFAVQQSYIDEMSSEEYKRLNAINIEQVIIKVIEKRFHCAEQLKQEMSTKLNILEKNIRNEHILGTDDEIIFLYNIGWGEFLKLYDSKEGIFYNSSEIYRESIAGATTTICTGIDEKKCLTEWEITDSEVLQEDRWKENYKKCIACLRTKLEKTGEKYKELYVILNTLAKFSGEVFSDYLFFSVIRPLKALIGFLTLENLENSYNDAYYEFINGFNMYIQNSVKSDRHTMQIMDFNSKIYDIPVKLNAFYIAFIYDVCDFLNIPKDNEEPHTYDFFVVPGATNIVNVLELYSMVSEKERMLRVEIPEDRFYDICNIMRIFSHEVAHYVGTKLRNRRNRFEYITESIAVIYTNYVKSYWYNEQIEYTLDEDMWKLVSQRVKYMFKEMLGRELDSNYVENRQLVKHIKDRKYGKQAENIVKYNINHWDSMDFLRKYAYQAMSDIILTKIDNVYQDMLYGLSEENSTELRTWVNIASRRFLARHIEGSTIITMDTVYDLLESVYEECFADLEAIYILGLSGKDYLNMIISDAESQNLKIETLRNSEVIYRITLIMDIMSEKKGNEWLSNINEDDGLQKSRWMLVNRSNTIYKNAIKPCKYDKAYASSSFRALMDENVYNNVRKYLCECYDSSCEELGRKENIPQKIYKDLCNKGLHIEDSIGVMEKYIDKYKKSLFDKNCIEQ